jgi:hypothetical protein
MALSNKAPETEPFTLATPRALKNRLHRVGNPVLDDHQADLIAFDGGGLPC